MEVLVLKLQKTKKVLISQLMMVKPPYDNEWCACI